MYDKAVELFHLTRACSSGSCTGCERIDNCYSGNTYFCQKQLFKECNEFLSELIDYFEEEGIL